MKNQQKSFWKRVLLLLPILFSVFELSVLQQAAASESCFKTYVNDRFGYQIDYPNFLKPQGEPTNEDGQVFLSKTANAEMRAYGGYLVAFTFDEEYSNALTDKWQQTGKPVVTYKSRGKDWFVVSGTIAKKIFYRKSVCKKDMIRTVTFLYPISEKATYDKVIGHTVSTFKWCESETK